MAPIRRYLRITKYSALECRIYLEDPALSDSWLLSPRHNVLSRVINSVRPMVLPKLREERERAKKKSGAAKKKSIKDIVVKDDFEVSVYLIETPIRHALLAKHKKFRDKRQTKLTSNSSKLLGGGKNTDEAIDIGAIEEDDTASASVGVPHLLVEDSDEDADILRNIPQAPAAKEPEARNTGRQKRQRPITIPDSDDEDFEAGVASSGEEDSDDDQQVEREESELGSPPSERVKGDQKKGDVEGGDNKQKVAMEISYDGFSIFGRVLCLVVKKRGTVTTGMGDTIKMAGTQALVDNWISSTQMPVGDD